MLALILVGYGCQRMDWPSDRPAAPRTTATTQADSDALLLRRHLERFSVPSGWTKAVYEPPLGKKVLIFVEDRLARVHDERIKPELSRRIGEKLLEANLAAATVDYEKLQELSRSDDFDSTSIADVGKKLGAELVLYVNIESFPVRDSGPDRYWWLGDFSASVRWIDAEKGGRIWPNDRPPGTGYPVPPLDLKPPEDPPPPYGEKVAKYLSEQMADRIAKLFYDHRE